MSQLLDKITRAYRDGGVSEIGRRAYKKYLHPRVNRTSLFLHYLVPKERSRLNKLVTALEREGIGTKLTRSDLLSHKTSDTLFVLASGGSINQITENQWAIIEEHDSIGLNRWPIHRFVPTYYVFELPTDHEMRETFYELLAYRKEAYRNTPTIIKDLDRTEEIVRKSNIKSHVEGRLLLSRDTNFPGYPPQPEPQQRLLQWLSSQGYFTPQQPLDLLYRERASITYLIHLASLLGYENIVLCGVDMVNSEYFFTNYKEELKQKGIPIPEPDITDTNRTHPTNDPGLDRIPLETLIFIINDVALQPNDINLYVENTLSALHPRIPVYDYDHT